MRARRLVRAAGFAVAALLLLALGSLLWLYVDAQRDRLPDMRERQGQLASVERERLPAAPALIATRVRLESTSGLGITLRVLRPRDAAGPLPVLMLLGGHRTGAEAVELFDDVGERIVVALDYPYEGELSTRTLVSALVAVRDIRRTFLDAPPAIWLAAEWVAAQDWADPQRVVLAGVSLGVPFAATAAAHNERIAALLIVHGAADNRAWIEHNIARRASLGPLLGPAATIANWLVHGDLHDTARHVGMLSPRPVVIVGAREDERVPTGQTETLFAAAGEPKTLRWTEGRHVQTGRRDIVDELLRLADEEIGRLLDGRTPP